jgi:hypothetical protein
MKDYLLRFDSKEQAVEFGLASGFVSFDENNEPFTTLATHTYAVAVLGPWVRQTGTDQDGNPIVESDNKHWVMFRDLVGLPIPTGAEQFIFWDSDLGPRPEDCPNMMWA